MSRIRFMPAASKAASSLSVDVRGQIEVAALRAADDREALIRHGYAVARAAGMVALVQPDKHGTVQVLALVGEAEWDAADGAQDGPASVAVQKIVWHSQARLRRGRLDAATRRAVEHAVLAQLALVGREQVLGGAVEVAGWVAVCDLDASGTAAIHGLFAPEEFMDLVEGDGDDDGEEGDLAAALAMPTTVH